MTIKHFYRTLPRDGIMPSLPEYVHMCSGGLVKGNLVIITLMYSLILLSVVACGIPQGYSSPGLLSQNSCAGHRCRNPMLWLSFGGPVQENSLTLLGDWP